MGREDQLDAQVFKQRTQLIAQGDIGWVVGAIGKRRHMKVRHDPTGTGTLGGEDVLFEPHELTVCEAMTFFEREHGHEMDIADIPLINDGKKPVWIFVDLAEEKTTHWKVRIEQQLKQGSVHLRTAAYLPYKDNLQRVAKLGSTAKEVDEQTRYRPQNSEDSVRYYPLSARYSGGLLGIDTRDGSVVELLDKKEPLKNDDLKEKEALQVNQPNKEAS